MRNTKHCIWIFIMFNYSVYSQVKQATELSYSIESSETIFIDFENINLIIFDFPEHTYIAFNGLFSTLINELSLEHISKISYLSSEVNEFILIESPVYGASGVAANIIKYLLVFVDDGEVVNLEFNSFVTTNDIVYVDDKQLVVEVFKYSIDESRKEEFYYSTIFMLDGNALKSINKGFMYDSSGKKIGEYERLLEHPRVLDN